MEIATHQRDFSQALEEGLVEIIGDYDSKRELRNLIRRVVPSQYFVVPVEPEFKSKTEDEVTVRNRQLKKMIDDWENYETKKKNRVRFNI